jgi:hypothetical protein
MDPKKTENVITVRIKSVYGQDLIYPVDRKAVLFTQLSGKKTFDKRDINNIRTLGFEVKVVAPSLSI